MPEYITGWYSNTTGAIHVYVALLALLCGPLAILLRKGSTAHRAAGLTYTAAMLTVNISALLKYDLTGSFNLFHAAALFSLATLLPAWLTIYRARTQRRPALYPVHGRLMAWSYFGLLMALVAEILTRQYPYMLHGDGGWMRFSTTLAIAMAATLERSRPVASSRCTRKSIAG